MRVVNRQTGMNVDRRKFLKFLGVAPVAVATASVACVATISLRPTVWSRDQMRGLFAALNEGMAENQEVPIFYDTERHHIFLRDVCDSSCDVL